jgi:hypothetical protein
VLDALLTGTGATDVSPEFEDTWAFLDRRISGIMEAGSVIDEMSQASCGGFYRVLHAP